MKKSTTSSSERATTRSNANPFDPKALTNHLAQSPNLLLPCLELLRCSKLAVDELFHAAGKATIQALLELSAAEIAGPKRQGCKNEGEIHRHGYQDGVVALAERKIHVKKPRLRRKDGGKGAEIDVPAYELLQRDARFGARILEILLAGVSTRNYEQVIPQVADTVGVSKSSISREFVEKSAEALEKLQRKHFTNYDLVVMYIDGMVFGEHHLLVALGVDRTGHKHLLGLRLGASENSVVVRDLLTDLVERGVQSEKKMLFVIDGSKALRKGIREVFGEQHPVQRCRLHKVLNVLSYLPDEQKERVKFTMKAAYRLDAKEGKERLEALARELEGGHPDAAGSLREGLAETFTINELGLPGKLRRCLATTNIIESGNSAVRRLTNRVTRMRDGEMVKRWAGAALLEAESHFKRISGYRDLWILESALERIWFEMIMPDTAFH